MHTLELLTPWLTLAVVLFPLVSLERWIHRHLYGIGWLLTQKRQRATLLYYLILLPGVFLHEFTQWLVAGMINIPIKKVTIWPKAQKNGTLRLDFVQIKKTGRVASTIIGLAPLLPGLALVLFISRQVFDLQGVMIALSTGELAVVLAELERLLTTPDFWLWLYLLFAIGNGMVPAQEDRQNWRLMVAILAGIAAVIMLVGLSEILLVPTLQGPVNSALSIVITALSTILVVDVFVVVLLIVIETLLTRFKGPKAAYNYRRTQTKSTQKPVPGGETPLPSTEAPKPVTERSLPIPGMPEENPPKVVEAVSDTVSDSRSPGKSKPSRATRGKPAGNASVRRYSSSNVSIDETDDDDVTYEPFEDIP